VNSELVGVWIKIHLNSKTRVPDIYSKHSVSGRIRTCI